MVWGLPRCVWARESTAPARRTGNSAQNSGAVHRGLPALLELGVKVRLGFVCSDRRSHCPGARGSLRELCTQAEKEPSGHPTGVRAWFAWVCFDLLAVVLSYVISSPPWVWDLPSPSVPCTLREPPCWGTSLAGAGCLTTRELPEETCARARRHTERRGTVMTMFCYLPPFSLHAC